MAAFKYGKLISVLCLMFWSCFALNQDCRGDTCVDNFDIPMLDKYEAPLKAELDMTAFNKQIKLLVKAQVNASLTGALKEMMNDVIDGKIKKLEEHLRTNNVTDNYSMSRLRLLGILSKSENGASVLDSGSRTIVALTSCSPDHKIITQGNNIIFSDVITAYGIQGLPKFQLTGVFECNSAGLYQVIVSVKTHTDSATFGIYKNKDRLISGHVADHSVRDSTTNYDHTGTMVVMVMLNVTDTVSVHVDKDMYLHNQTCVSIVKF